MSDLTPTKEEATAYRAIRKRHKLTIREILPALLGAIEPESECVVDFVENLPHVRLGKLPEQVDTCTICQLEFGNETEESDSAVRLSCGHFFGADCLKRRFMQHETCSICHAKVFDRPVIEDWAFPEMRRLVANFYRVTCTFLRSQNQNDESDSRYATFVAWSNVVGGTNILWAEVYRQMAREVIADLNLFEH